MSPLLLTSVGSGSDSEALLWKALGGTDVNSEDADQQVRCSPLLPLLPGRLRGDSALQSPLFPFPWDHGFKDSSPARIAGLQRFSSRSSGGKGFAPLASTTGAPAPRRSSTRRPEGSSRTSGTIRRGVLRSWTWRPVACWRGSGTRGRAPCTRSRTSGSTQRTI
ncbi:unnamed protein product [Ectocarpus fasciculatus]